MCDLFLPQFTDETKAREWLEGELWPNGPVCPHCGVVNEATALKGKAHRPGLYQCNACREQFTVTVGTLYERSKIALHKWLAATHLMMASKKGMSALEISRLLGISYKSTWFMCHRIRESLRPTESNPSGPIGGEGTTVEADTTYIGGKEKNKHASKRDKKHIGGVGKEAVFSLVERGGQVRSHHMDVVSAKTLRPILASQIKDANLTALMTDGEGQYRILVDMFGSHASVNHGIGEYVRGAVHTNTIESYFAILKRGVTGTFHHVSQQHLKRYLAEFDFRYNERSALGVTDFERTAKSVKGIVGKRMTYRRIGGAKEATQARA